MTAINFDCSVNSVRCNVRGEIQAIIKTKMVNGIALGEIVKIFEGTAYSDTGKNVKVQFEYPVSFEEKFGSSAVHEQIESELQRTSAGWM